MVTRVSLVRRLNGALSTWAPRWPIRATFRDERGDAHAQVSAVLLAREMCHLTLQAVNNWSI